MREKLGHPSAWALAAGLIFAACGSHPDVDVLSRYAPIEQQGISTDAIYPEDAAYKNLMGEGWEPLTKEVRPGTGRLVIGGAADFRFYAVLPGPYTLELEGLTPLRPPRTQNLTVLVNGERVGTATMTTDWESYAFSVPAETVHPGWNVVRLRFRTVLKPKEIQRETRPLAASFRRLGVRPGSERPEWEERPLAIRVRSDRWGANLLEMPADSQLDAYVALGQGPRLVGTVEVTPARSGSPADLNAAVDLIDQTGKSQTLFTRTFTAAQRESFEVPLEKWADSTVQFRLRTWGRTNGIVQWRDTGVVRTGGPNAVPQLSGDPQPAPQSKRLGRPNVLVVLLDTARDDAVHSNRPEGHTPNIAAVAKGGTRFTQAWSPASWTAMTVPSLLSGRYPQALGVDDWGSQIPNGVPTLPELAAKGGYRTFLWGQHNIWKGNDSLRRGFQEEQILKASAPATRELLPTATDLFVEGKPTFAMIHLLPPHGPYTPPKPFRGTLTAGLARAFWRDPTDDPDPEWLARNWSVQKLGKKEPYPEVVRYIRARYDENALYADHLVGRLVETIRAAGQYDNTMIVILADHGEAFFEHGNFFHSSTLYQELLHVPLVIKWPVAVRGFAQVVDEPVTLIDLVPTLVDGLGLPADGTGFQGQTLLPLVLDKASLERDLFAITRPDVKVERRIHTIRAGRYKVIYYDDSKTTELFDLVADPGERVDLAQKDPVRAGALLQRLLLRRDSDFVALAKMGGSRRNRVQEETMKALRALGYVQ